MRKIYYVVVGVLILALLATGVSATQWKNMTPSTGKTYDNAFNQPNLKPFQKNVTAASGSTPPYTAYPGYKNVFNKPVIKPSQKTTNGQYSSVFKIPWK